jgi:hypothetical protein
MDSRRPTFRELDRKIAQAKKAVSQDKIFIPEPNIIAADALTLGYRISEISDVLIDLLGALTPRNYIGRYPPERSYKEEIRDCELFVFQALSNRLGCTVYFKFALKMDFIYIISLHEFKNTGIGADL